MMTIPKIVIFLQRRRRFLFLVFVSVLFIASLFLLSSKAPHASFTLKNENDKDLPAMTTDVFDANNFIFMKPKQLPVLDNPVWFIQITDLHLSANGGQPQKDELYYFLNNTLDIIKPSVVLATGDLTRSVHNHGLTLSENREEWMLYQDLLSELHSKYPNLLWLDLPGNHDNFDEEHLKHYSYYSVRRNNYSSSVIRLKYGIDDAVTFIPIDASLKPGLRAFNFFGHISEKQCQHLQQTMTSATSKDDIVILYGHYTTSTIISKCNLHNLFSHSTMYVCGHLHNIYGLVPSGSFWHKHDTGYMELELADWAKNHRYRIIALDGHEVTWLDLDSKTWPAVLITSINIIREKRRPYAETKLLVFSNEEITRVRLGSSLSSAMWVICRQIQGPVYTAKIDFRQYEGSWPKVKHDLLKTFQVRLEIANQRTITLNLNSPQMTSLLPERSLIGVLLLTTRLYMLCFVIYVICVGICMSLIILGRLYHKGLIKEKYKLGQLSNVDQCFIPTKLLLSLEKMTKDSLSYWLLIIFIIYPVIGPWYIGRLAGERTGWVFLWSVIVDGHDTLPGEVTYREALILVTTLQMPLLFVLLLRNSILDKKSKNGRMINVIFGVVILMQVPAIIGWLIYDSIAQHGPIRLALLIVSLTLWMRYR